MRHSRLLEYGSVGREMGSKHPHYYRVVVDAGAWRVTAAESNDNDGVTGRPASASNVCKHV